MGRDEVHEDMEQLLGMVVPFFERLPDEFIDSEWDVFKRLQLGETVIPARYKQLIAIAAAAVAGCRSTTNFLVEVARLRDITEAEIAESVHQAKLVAGWSVYVNALEAAEERTVQPERQIGREAERNQ